jgi:hypothetical protein
MVEVCYYWGYAGTHDVTWVSVDARGNRTKLKEQALTYALTSKDIGCVIEVIVVPVRSDGLRGVPVTASTQSPVVAAPPTVLSVPLVASAAAASEPLQQQQQ